MDLNMESILNELPETTADHSDLPPACVLCHSALSSENEEDLELIGICGDCRFLMLADFGSPAQDTHRRTPTIRRLRRRSRRHRSSESVENVFSQQFSHIINLARQNMASSTPEHENQSVDGDAASRLVQRTSSRTTPNRSTRWRRVVLSDTESDDVDSIYGETESNLSVNGYRLFHTDGDTLSYSAYGGHSDASIDSRSIDIFAHPDGRSDLDSDTDIDPMNAAVYQWNVDNQVEDAGEEDIEWEEADTEGNVIESVGVSAQPQRSPRPTGSNAPTNWINQLHSLDTVGTYITNSFADLEEHDMRTYVGNAGNYLDARGFIELLEHLAETDSSRRAAPPATVSVVNRLPLVTVNKEHGEQDGLACAICKDELVGTVANQLPCHHLYHPSCILPWLSIRNSCPLCRYELPTDDKDYEEQRQNNDTGFVNIHVGQQLHVNYDSSSDLSDGAEAEMYEFDHRRTEQRELVNADPVVDRSGRNEDRGRWLYVAAAAAPIVSLVGIALVFWLGSPFRGGRGSIHHCELATQGEHSSQGRAIFPTNQRETSRSRRWWSFF